MLVKFFGGWIVDLDLSAGYSFFDSGDVELLGERRKTHYGHVGELYIFIPGRFSNMKECR